MDTIKKEEIQRMLLFEEAFEIAERAFRLAKNVRQSVSICVADSRRNVLIQCNMDGTTVPEHQASQMLAGICSSTGAASCNGMPIYTRDGSLIGGLGIAGGSEENGELCMTTIRTMSRELGIYYK